MGMYRVDQAKYLLEVIRNIREDELNELYLSAVNENPWFTKENVSAAFEGIVRMMDNGALDKWVSAYDEIVSPKKVGLVLAGNIPMVGFHDLLSVYISGHTPLVKLSSQDSALMKFIISTLNEVGNSAIELVERLSGFDAVIATGSNNTSRYFEHYFSKYPHVIRKNRTSIAVLNGDEDDKTLTALGKDVFSYFGLGCRNVSHMLIPENYDISRLAPCWTIYQDVINHHKYANNYDHNKSLYLINLAEHLDFGFLLVRRSEQPFSPISVLSYASYSSAKELDEIIGRYGDSIQCIVGKEMAPGEAQTPTLLDYADGIDTMKFLREI